MKHFGYYLATLIWGFLIALALAFIIPRVL